MLVNQSTDNSYLSLDIYQFYNSAQRLALAIETSGLMAAVKNCRVQLTSADRSAGDTNRPLAEAMLLRAGNDYREHAERFTADDCHVAEHFHLLELGTADYWDDLTTTTAPAASRLGELVSLYSRLMFANSHLPRLLSLISGSGAHVTDDLSAHSDAACRFVLELADLTDVEGSGKFESAGDPDRIAKVIDGANRVYRGAALLAGSGIESFRLSSVTGANNRKLVTFEGHQEAATAVRRIIRYLSEISSAHGVESVAADETGADSASASVEAQVAEMPFLASLDTLEQIGALSPVLIGEIRADVAAGAIMLVDAGVSLVEQQSPTEELPFQPGETGVVESEVEAHYLDRFQVVRERMLGDTVTFDTDQPGEAAAGKRFSQQPIRPEFRDDQSDELDDLIVDLNRLYKR